jgi:hypothetical protein
MVSKAYSLADPQGCCRRRYRPDGRVGQAGLAQEPAYRRKATSIGLGEPLLSVSLLSSSRKDGSLHRQSQWMRQIGVNRLEGRGAQQEPRRLESKPILMQCVMLCAPNQHLYKHNHEHDPRHSIITPTMHAPRQAEHLLRAAPGRRRWKIVCEASARTGSTARGRSRMRGR